jgi:diphthamide biosynthesis enzyme Dph1/Dph2-like protein
MEFSELWELKATAAYVKRNGYTRVTMQFPDDMLHDSPVVADALQTELTAAGSDAKVRPVRATSCRLQCCWYQHPCIQ